MTIYQLVDEVCARDFPFFARLTSERYKQLVDIIYDEVMSGDKPEEATEDSIADFVEDFIAGVVAQAVEEIIDFSRS